MDNGEIERTAPSIRIGDLIEWRGARYTVQDTSPNSVELVGERRLVLDRTVIARWVNNPEADFRILSPD